MKKFTLDAASVASLMKAGAAVSEAQAHLANAVINDDEQFELDLDGEGRANEAFMDEREDLLATIHELRHERDVSSAVLLQVAGYANDLQAQFNAIGIRYYADPQTGEPTIELFDPGALLLAIQANLDAARA